MVMLPEEREENIIASLNTYLAANLPTGMSVEQVDFGGSGVQEEDHDEWLRADVMITTPRYSRQVDQDGNMGSEPLVMFNVNIFRKQTVHESDIYRLTKLGDELKNKFRVPLGIPVYDHEGSPSTRIGTLQTYELNNEPMPFDQSKGIYGRNVTSTMRYVMKWEAPS